MNRILARTLPMLLSFAEFSAISAESLQLNVWPKDPPPSVSIDGEEHDTTQPTDKMVAGKRVMRIGNVSTPKLEIHLPNPAIQTGAAVLVCPGGGFHILAWDLEGTEVAEWLNSIGIAAVILKYRVPTRSADPRWLPPVQDAQRAMSLIRFHAKDWNIDPKRVGILGFSAGGLTAAITATGAGDRLYPPVDEMDQIPFRPDFAVLVYAAWLLNEDQTQVAEHFTISESTPPTFLVHAYDDPISALNPALFFAALKRQNVPAELHIYDAGGHGYGLRPQESLPVTSWPTLCTQWMKRRNLIPPQK